MWLIETIYDVSGLIAALQVLALPLAAIRPIRGHMGAGLIYSSFFLGFALWLGCCLYVLANWGVWVLLLSFLLLGVGSVPLSFVLVIAHRDWEGAAGLAFALVWIFGSRALGYRISSEGAQGSRQPKPLSEPELRAQFGPAPGGFRPWKRRLQPLRRPRHPKPPAPGAPPPPPVAPGAAPIRPDARFPYADGTVRVTSIENGIVRFEHTQPLGLVTKRSLPLTLFQQIVQPAATPIRPGATYDFPGGRARVISIENGIVRFEHEGRDGQITRRSMRLADFEQTVQPAPNAAPRPVGIPPFSEEES